MEIILYTTHCPKCKVLETKLKAANIEYTECDNVDEMLKIGLSSAPNLSVNGKIYDFKGALNWVKTQL